MKRKPLLTLALVLGLGALSSLAWVGVSHAADIRASDSPTVSSTETVNSSLYAAGKKITIAGTVKGDVFCAGMEVEITGTVEGDVLCAAQTIRIGGQVLGDIRAAASEVIITATISGSATLAAEKAKFAPSSTIGRDVTVAAQNTVFEGLVGRDVLGTVQTITITKTIGRNLDLEAENITLTKEARVGGDLTYSSAQTASITDGAVITGKTTYHEALQSDKVDTNAIKLWVAGYWMSAMLIIGVLAILLLPRWTDNVAGAMRSNPLYVFAGGATVFLLTPLVAIACFVSLVGIPLGLILMTLWLAALFASLSLSSYGLGWIVVEKLGWPTRARRLASLFIGALLLTLLGLVPWVGGLVTFAAVLMGVGALESTIRKAIRPSTKKAKA